MRIDLLSFTHRGIQQALDKVARELTKLNRPTGSIPTERPKSLGGYAGIRYDPEEQVLEVYDPKRKSWVTIGG